jgi:hypothetical protein
VVKYTNKLNLPEPIFRALITDDYDPGLGDYTPSSLNAPVYQKKLLSLYDDQIVIDCVENFHLLMGKAAHTVLETGTGGGWKEVRIYAQIGKWLVSMQLDHLWVEKGIILQDYKNTTVYKFTKDFNGNLPEVPEWEAQLNIGAYIFRHSPMVNKGGKLQSIDTIQINGLQIIGLLKDWSKSKARRDSRFPQTPIYPRDMPFWTDKRVEDYITERASAHDDAKNKPIEQIPPCSDEEVWARPTVYAVMVRGNKRSKKNCGSQAEAEQACRKYPGSYVEVRPGERPRCQDYCNVSKFCPDNLKRQESK